MPVAVRTHTLATRNAASHDLRGSLLAAVLLLALPSLARASDVPQRLPAGYVTEAVGPVRWTYPSAARDEVRALQHHEPVAFARIASELGASISAQLDIRVARNPEHMQALSPAGAALPGYADGIAFPDRGLILLTLTAPRTFLRPDMNRVLTHEISHVALQRAVNGARLPRWLTEGVAVHQAAESSVARTRTLWEGTLRGTLRPLSALSAGFPATRGEVDLAYAQSADFVAFLLSGPSERASFQRLLRELAAGRPLDAAFEAAYRLPLRFLERQWRDALGQRFGRWPALLMGLTFLWVIGAALLVVGYVRARRRHARTLRRWEIAEAPLLAPAPPAPQGTGVVPPPPPLPPSQLDELLESRRNIEPGVPTVTHDGHSYTLH